MSTPRRAMARDGAWAEWQLPLLMVRKTGAEQMQWIWSCQVWNPWDMIRQNLRSKFLTTSACFFSIVVAVRMKPCGKSGGNNTVPKLVPLIRHWDFVLIRIVIIWNLSKVKHGIPRRGLSHIIPKSMCPWRNDGIRIVQVPQRESLAVSHFQKNILILNKNFLHSWIHLFRKLSWPWHARMLPPIFDFWKHCGSSPVKPGVLYFCASCWIAAIFPRVQIFLCRGGLCQNGGLCPRFIRS